MEDTQDIHSELVSARKNAERLRLFAFSLVALLFGAFIGSLLNWNVNALMVLSLFANVFLLVTNMVVV